MLFLLFHSQAINAILALCILAAAWGAFLECRAGRANGAIHGFWAWADYAFDGAMQGISLVLFAVLVLLAVFFAVALIA